MYGNMFIYSQMGISKPVFLLDQSLLECNGTLCFKNVSNDLNTNIYSNLKTCGSQSSNLYLNVVHFFNTSVNYTFVTTYDVVFSSIGV